MNNDLLLDAGLNEHIFPPIDIASVTGVDGVYSRALWACEPLQLVVVLQALAGSRTRVEGGLQHVKSVVAGGYESQACPGPAEQRPNIHGVSLIVAFEYLFGVAKEFARVAEPPV